MSPRIKGDLPLLGRAKEPIVLSCEQCNDQLAFVLGDATFPEGVVICPECLDNLAEWAAR